MNIQAFQWSYIFPQLFYFPLYTCTKAEFEIGMWESVGYKVFFEKTFWSELLPQCFVWLQGNLEHMNSFVWLSSLLYELYALGQTFVWWGTSSSSGIALDFS